MICTIDDCQLLVVGGKTSAFGTIISASKFLNTCACLLEPTDWVGGQLTAELLSASDFACHTIKDTDNLTLNVRAIDQQLNNQNPLFAKMLTVLGDTGGFYVSPSCSIASLFRPQAVLPEVNNTRIFYNTVIKRGRKDASGRFLSEELSDSVFSR